MMTQIVIAVISTIVMTAVYCYDMKCKFRSDNESD